MAYDPSNYINGVDQRTVAQQRKDEKEQAMKKAAKLKEGMRGRILNVKTKSPSATDVQSGKVSGAVKSNKSKTTVKETAMKKSNLTDKMPAMSGPMRRKTIETLKQDAKNALPKGPAKPNTMKKAPATGMKTTAKKAAAKPMAKPATKAPAKTTTKAPVKTTTKTPVKKKVVQMPSKISPSKMTPAQKAKYLQNPERYDG